MRKLIAVFMLLTITILGGCTKNENEGILRLHVIANSNSAFDQAVKLKVKDKVSVIMAEKGITTYEEAIKIALNEQDMILQTANQVLLENGADYVADMEVGTYHFPEKTYGTATFKEGNYNAVRLKLGEAKGENWWCVMFPPICFIDSGSGDWDLGTEENVEFKSLLAAVIK